MAAIVTSRASAAIGAGGDQQTSTPAAAATPWAQLRDALAAAVATPHPGRANQLITALHHQLSLRLARRLGADSGANFHTWAVWGSLEAGVTIAGRQAWRIIGCLAAAITGMVAAGCMLAGHAPSAAPVAAGMVVVSAGALTQARTRRHISEGNRIVIEEIGAATITFLEHLDNATSPDPAALGELVNILRQGARAGERSLLAEAFSAYHEATFEDDRKRCHELVFTGNCLAVWHEHVRLQHHIECAMPVGLRRWMTSRLLDFRVGAEHLHVARDLVPVGACAAADTLAELQEPRAVAIAAEMRRPGRAAGTGAGSAAADWAAFTDRMNYIGELFRSRHSAIEVFADPPSSRSGAGAVMPALRLRPRVRAGASGAPLPA